MSNIQNIGGIVTTGPVNGPISNVYSISQPAVGSIDWNRLSGEVAKLNSQQLPPSAQQFATEMKDACAKKDESKVKGICAKLGQFVLAFVESLGLELIASLITECVLG